ncbi:unnamed protein product [Penicillium manginii]
MQFNNTPWNATGTTPGFAGQALGWMRFFCCTMPARGLQASFTWELSRKFWYSFLFVSIFFAKLLHIWAHIDSIPVGTLFLWGSTFFVQDIIFLFLAHLLSRSYQHKWIRIGAATTMIVASLVLSVMAAANTSFYFTTGAEIHWRQAGGFNRDPASINTLLTGLTGLVIVEALYIVVAAFATPHLYNAVGGVMHTWSEFFVSITKPLVKPVFRPLMEMVFSRWSRGRKLFEDLKIYEPVPLGDYEDDEDKMNSAPLLDQPTQPRSNEEDFSLGLGLKQRWMNRMNSGFDDLKQDWRPIAKRALIIVPTAIIFILRLARPSEQALWFMSQTVIISPFAGVDSKGKLQMISDDPYLHGKLTALTAPPRWDWFPEGNWPGFRDWEKGGFDGNKYSHYNATEDPLTISNLGEDILVPLRDALHGGKVNIKHIFVFKMESTRYDVFPLRKGSYMHERLVKSHKNKRIPKDVQRRLANLTSVAERLTGAESGFHKKGAIKPYGGIRADNSYTGGTFTLKSIEATTCGLSPLVIDFNKEYEHHIYNPCMPQVLDVLSAKTNDTKSSDYKLWPWRPTFMQSITDTYDHQNLLSPALGFKPENIVTVESIDEDIANGKNFNYTKFNFWGYPDGSLKGYFREAIESAEANHERLFLTHLTGITHHPWDTPDGKYDDLFGSESNSFGGKNDQLNRYLNTVGVNDKWYGDFLGLLEETGVANETLIVMTGDHGLSLPEDGNVTPYDNPLVSNFHVPLIFANPNIPPISINSSVSSVQIMPTILDLLKTSGSLDHVSARAVGDLLPMYEGQSMIRPIIAENNSTAYYQFTVMNTGGSLVAMRSANRPYRLVVPLVNEVEWRFSDPSTDPQEQNPIKSFDLDGLIKAVEEKHGSDAVKWTHDASHAAQWWVADNWRRYEYDPSRPKSSSKSGWSEGYKGP